MLFPKLTRRVYQLTFFCMKCSLKRRALFEKDMLEKHCAVVKSCWWHVWKTFIEKITCHTMRTIMSSLWKEINVKSSDIRGLWKKKDDVKEPVTTEENMDSVDMLTDTATADFGCASSSSKSKKGDIIEVAYLIIYLFFLCYLPVTTILVFETNCFC